MLRRSLLCACLLCIVSALHADTYTDPSCHCSFEVPSGWHTMSSGDLSQVRTYLHFDFIIGAKRPDGNLYVLVQTFRRTPGTPADLLKGYSNTMRINGVDVQNITVDESRQGNIGRSNPSTRTNNEPPPLYPSNPSATHP